jgi:hypothetical protein
MNHLVPSTPNTYKDISLVVTSGKKYEKVVAFIAYQKSHGIYAAQNRNS